MNAERLSFLSGWRPATFALFRAAWLRGDMLGRVIQQYLGAMLLDDNEEFCFIDEQTAGRKTSHQLIVDGVLGLRASQKTSFAI